MAHILLSWFQIFLCGSDESAGIAISSVPVGGVDNFIFLDFFKQLKPNLANSDRIRIQKAFFLKK